MWVKLNICEGEIIVMDILEQIMTDKSKKVRMMSPKTRRVFDSICHKWPVNPLEVATYLKEDGDVKSLSAKYLYHFRKLSDSGLIRLKKIGNTYVAWPVEIERLRVVHQMTREF
jgi:hypothetical protein